MKRKTVCCICSPKLFIVFCYINMLTVLFSVRASLQKWKARFTNMSPLAHNHTKTRIIVFVMCHRVPQAEIDESKVDYSDRFNSEKGAWSSNDWRAVVFLAGNEKLKCQWCQARQTVRLARRPYSAGEPRVSMWCRANPKSLEVTERWSR